YADAGGFFRSVQDVLSRLREDGSVAALAGAGYAVTELGEHARITGGDTSTGPRDLSVQHTVGVELGGVADLLRWARGNSPHPRIPQTLTDIDAGLTFGDEVAGWFSGAHGTAVGAGVPVVAGGLLHSGDIEEIRGFAALVYTHAMAFLREADAKAAGHSRFSPLLGAKQYLAAASRHTAEVMRSALSDQAREFLDRNAGQLKKLFVSYAGHAGPRSIRNPLGVKIGPGYASVADYLDTAFLNDPLIPVLPNEYGMETGFELDTSGAGQSQQRPLVLIELRNVADADNVAMLQAQYQELAGHVSGIFAQVRTREARSLPSPGDSREFARWLGGQPQARNAEALLRGLIHLNSLPAVLARGDRVDLRRGDLLLASARQPASPPGAVLSGPDRGELAAELKHIISQLDRLDDSVRSALHAGSGPGGLSEVVAPLAATTAAARRLLAGLDPGAGSPVADERFLLNWTQVSAVPNSRRSPEVRRIDASVAALLAHRDQPGRLRQVLADIYAWHRSRQDADLSRRRPAIDGLEQRIVHELGEHWNPPLPGARAGVRLPPRPAQHT
ncbi:MAG TPA: hypothetical protein VHF26_26565, partial [Trebonia sp.]|nr:hypothetical protein [Trebonia sp.]